MFRFCFLEEPCGEADVMGIVSRSVMCFVFAALGVRFIKLYFVFL